MSDYTDLRSRYDDERRRGRWETIAVTVLPTEWTNVFYNVHDDEFRFDRCPAILLQELRAAFQVSVTAAVTNRRTYPSDLSEDEIGVTRAVFAIIDDQVLRAADHFGSYLTTVTGGEPDDATRAELLYAAHQNARIELPESVATRIGVEVLT
jgi:hypothetical protein